MNEADLELTDDPLLTLPDFRIGKNGAEKVLETSLRGEAGSRQVEVNAYGRVIREAQPPDRPARATITC